MSIKEAYRVLRLAGFPPDAYRWLKVRALYAWAFRVLREKEKGS